MSQNSFDYRAELPSDKDEDIARSLIGFDARYQMMRNHLKMILSPDEVDVWAAKYHQKGLALCQLMRQRHPMFLFSGDVGTGKTVTAQCAANRLTKEMAAAGVLLKLGSQIRGRGLHGEMTQKVRDAFEELKSAAGKKRLAFLIIDEADAVASMRDTEQMHQEEKSAINTLIQRIDDVREAGGRIVVFLCTNRPHVLDQAIVRRAALHLEFKRPNEAERTELLTRDLNGLNLSDEDIQSLVRLTGADKDKCRPGYTYSDFRLRIYPHAVATTFPNKPLTLDGLKQAIQETPPSAEIK